VFYVRYLLLPTTLLASGAILFALRVGLAPSLGVERASTWAFALAILSGCTWVLLFEWLYPAAGVVRKRPTARLAADIAFSTLSAGSLIIAHSYLATLPDSGLLGPLSAALRLWERPFALQLVVTFVVSELILYAWHRAEHQSGSALLWSFHAFHHRAPELASATGGRASPVDLLMAGLSIFAVRAIGIDPDVALICLWYSSMLGSLHHSDLDIRLGWFNWVIPGPQQHHIHHSVDPARGRNDATNFPALDLIFGTAVPLIEVGSEPLGVEGDSERF
jgi:sterol desaturase/sphingolipid hydroxylase (fatty acid hydroxylase superfamily)